MKRLKAFLASILLFLASVLGSVPIAPAAGPNLVPNPSFETGTTAPSDWETNKWGTNSASFAYNTSGRTGSRSVKTTASSYTSGDAKWMFAPVAAAPNTAYTFSDWYTSSATTGVTLGITSTSGSVSYIWLGELPASSTWRQTSFTFTTPANTARISVYHYLNKTGSLTVDDVSLSSNTYTNPIAPTVSLTAPMNGATVSGTATLSANATDADGIAGVQFRVDGATVGTIDTTSPYSINWDSTITTNGQHTITAVATDKTGLSTTSGSATITVTNTTPQLPAGSNLIANPSYATGTTTPTNWASNKWGTNTTAFTYNSTGRTDSRSVTTKVTSYSSGDAKWSHTPIAVNPNTTYLFSDWYRSNVTTGVTLGITSTTGTVNYVWLGDVPASSGWKQTSFTFTTPANAAQVSVYHYIQKVGELTVDDFSVASQTTPLPDTTANLIANASVETGAALPDNWTSNSWGTNTSSMTYEISGRTGSRSLRTSITAYTSGDAKWSFAPVAVTPGKTYNYSTWYKSNVPTDLNAMVTMQDGTVQYYWLKTASAAADWQQITAQLTIPANAATLTVFQIMNKVGTLQNDDFSLIEYQPRKFNRALVSITFDDGWRSIYENGLPLMKKYGLVSTQYLNSKAVMEGYPDYMTYQMIKDLRAAGHELGWHTRSHADITKVSGTALTTELTIPAEFLTGTGTTAANYTNFASPYGAYNDASVTEVLKRYRSHRSTDIGYNTPDNFDIRNIHVQNILRTTTPADVQKWVNQAIADQSWLVLVYHEVAANPSDPTYAVTPANLDAELSIIKQSGVTVKTVEQALNELLPQL